MNEQSLAFLVSSVVAVAFLFLFWCAIVLLKKIFNLIDKMFGEKDEDLIPLERIFKETEGEEK